MGKFEVMKTEKSFSIIMDFLKNIYFIHIKQITTVAKPSGDKDGNLWKKVCEKSFHIK